MSVANAIKNHLVGVAVRVVTTTRDVVDDFAKVPSVGEKIDALVQKEVAETAGPAEMKRLILQQLGDEGIRSFDHLIRGPLSFSRHRPLLTEAPTPSELSDLTAEMSRLDGQMRDNSRNSRAVMPISMIIETKPDR